MVVADDGLARIAVTTAAAVPAGGGAALVSQMLGQLVPGARPSRRFRFLEHPALTRKFAGERYHFNRVSLGALLQKIPEILRTGTAAIFVPAEPGANLQGF